MIGISDPSQTGRAGTGVAVAMIDTAIDIGHPDLVLTDGTSVIFRDNRANIDFPCIAGDATAFGSSGIGHGTAIAGIIAGQGTTSHLESLPTRACTPRGFRH